VRRFEIYEVRRCGAVPDETLTVETA
jgi:hypothetical protein